MADNSDYRIKKCPKCHEKMILLHYIPKKREVWFCLQCRNQIPFPLAFNEDCLGVDFEIPIAFIYHGDFKADLIDPNKNDWYILPKNTE